MIENLILTLFFFLFAVGVLEFYDNRATWSQTWRGLATMGLSLVGMVLILFLQGVI